MMNYFNSRSLALALALALALSHFHFFLFSVFLFKGTSRRWKGSRENWNRAGLVRDERSNDGARDECRSYDCIQESADNSWNQAGVTVQP